MRPMETSFSSSHTRRSGSSNSNMPLESTALPETSICFTDAPPPSAIRPPSAIPQITENWPTPAVGGGSPAILEPNHVTSPHPPENLLLEPMTVEQAARHDRGRLQTIELSKHSQIPMALYTLTSPPTDPVPQGWIEFVIPEGQKYYYQPTRHIITDSNIKQPEILQAVVRALEMLDICLNAQNMILPQTTEITFEVDIKQHPPVVRYYFVDHAQRKEFWLETSTTERLKCPSATSYTHLKHLPRQHYWTHIEFYPMHLTLSAEVEDELIAVLTRICDNYVTSSLSTVPYNREQCEAYLRLIRSIPVSDQAKVYRNRILALIWSNIDENFFVDLRREDTPRLSCIRCLLQEPVNFLKGWLMLVSSRFCESVASETLVGDISHASRWRVPMGRMVGMWKMWVSWTLILLIVASITFVPSATSSTIRGWTVIFLHSNGLTPVVTALINLGASALLVKIHRKRAGLRDSTSSSASGRSSPDSISFYLSFLSLLVIINAYYLDFIATHIIPVGLLSIAIVSLATYLRARTHSTQLHQ